MNNNSLSSSAILGIPLALGIILAGYFISDALYKIRASERYVTVKGLAERNVEADLVIWPLSFSETSNELSELQNNINSKRRIIREFLLAIGFNDSEISELPPQITDFKAEKYIQNKVKREYRYMAQTTVTLRSRNVSLAKQAMERAGELVSKGIVLVAQSFNMPTQYLFTSLNKVKPDMIAEATQNARKAAEQFAKDSGSIVGNIKKARQGLFSIKDRDRSSPDHKKIRVVTTVEYYLMD